MSILNQSRHGLTAVATPQADLDCSSAAGLPNFRPPFERIGDPQIPLARQKFLVDMELLFHAGGRLLPAEATAV